MPENRIVHVNLQSTFHNFAFFDRKHGAIAVDFIHDERGKPGIIVMRVTNENGCREFSRNNIDGKYKPCVGHCKEFARLMLTKEANPDHKEPSRRERRMRAHKRADARKAKKAAAGESER